MSIRLNTCLSLISLVAMLILGARLAYATTYYVDPSGSDSNGGSQSSPFQTVGHAASVAQAGDTVDVDDGSYPETITLPRSGTISAPITFQSVNPQGAKIDGTGNNTLNLNGQSYIIINGFEITADQNSFCILTRGR